MLIPEKRNYKLYLKNLIPYAGRTRWALSRDAVEYILQFIEKERSMVKLFKMYISLMSLFSIRSSVIQILKKKYKEDWFIRTGALVELVLLG